MNGAKLNIGYNIYKSRIFESNISCGIGAMSGLQSQNNYKYAGIYADINILGFYLELGNCYRENELKPERKFAFGFIYRFIYDE